MTDNLEDLVCVPASPRMSGDCPEHLLQKTKTGRAALWLDDHQAAQSIGIPPCASGSSSGSAAGGVALVGRHHLGQQAAYQYPLSLAGSEGPALW